MEKLNETYIKGTSLNDRVDDPRIDSPEIKVIYPSEPKIEEPIEVIPRTKPVEISKEIIETVAPQIITPEIKPEEPKEVHVCTIGVQKAIEQNWIAFSLFAVALIGIGFAIGKTRS